MREELQARLKAGYPELFAGQDDTMPIKRWGIEVGDGWFGIIDAVLALAIWQAREGGAPITISDCKEKVGTLRIRFRGDVTGCLLGAADMARELSARTCWHCGSPGSPRAHSVVALCDGCAGAEGTTGGAGRRRRSFAHLP